MKAPEKIYLLSTPYRILDGWYDNELPIPKDMKQLEYTRTDAFIEKAVSYLNSKLYDWVQTTNPNQRSYANTIMKQDFIDDFKDYIKGE